jgi:hypothetical protein
MMEQILITSLITWGIYFATRYEWSEVDRQYKSRQVLSFISIYLDAKLPLWLRKPLYLCPPCMGSFWSLVTGIYYGFSVDLLLIIPAVCGMNYILNRLYPYSE